MESHEIIRTVFDAFKGLPKKLAGISDKSEAWYSSHGRAPKTEDPIASGNVSAVTHFMRYARKYEAVEPGAGQMLSHRVHGALIEEFAERDLVISQSDIHVEVIDQTSDVEKWLVKFDIKHATRPDLLGFERECDEAMESIYKAKNAARVRIKELELRKVTA